MYRYGLFSWERLFVDRVHRMGQEKCVIVHKLMVRGSVEERVLMMQEGKRRLARSMLDGNKDSEEGDVGEGKLDVQELKQMLRSGLL